VAAAAALPQQVYKRVGRNGTPERELTRLEPIKKAIPWNERAIVFERAAGAPQIDTVVAMSAVAFVNIALSKATPPHVCTEAFEICRHGRLSTTARQGASAAMLLQFIMEIIEAARRVDKAIVNVIGKKSRPTLRSWCRTPSTATLMGWWT